MNPPEHRSSPLVTVHGLEIHVQERFHEVEALGHGGSIRMGVALRLPTSRFDELGACSGEGVLVVVGEAATGGCHD